MSLIFQESRFDEDSEDSSSVTKSRRGSVGNVSSTSQSTIECVSSRVLRLNFNPSRGLHYHLPVLFDYFHLAAVSTTIHMVLSSLHQPYIKWVNFIYINWCIFLNFLALDVTTNSICEIHCLALDGLDHKTVHKLSRKEKKIQRSRDSNLPMPPSLPNNN